ncbi:hypothetical protein FNF28_03363 [Cafeteria roenbergensis]|uniref:DUF962 domain-containing protein n=2 Tax=Cafeteria roenbergensis TaxID=33653 RepID=A0A5A8DML8_CAFRO|nr:hypothetical protein FNF28_03363 [Cafeteria roenbergensis]
MSHSPVSPRGFPGTDKDKKSSDGGSVMDSVFAAALVAALGAVLYAAADQAVPALGLPGASDAKPHGSFWEFYEQNYLTDHANPQNKQMHFAGTGLVILLLAMYPGAALAMASALALGFGVFPYTRFLPNGAAEAAAVVSAFVLLSWRTTGKLYVPFLIMLCGYGFAWVGHFFIEGNRPATFIYPSYSLASDFVMLYQFGSSALSL